MAKNVIFFVHGVGRHAKDWSRIKGGPIHTLVEVSKQYECFNGLDLEKLVDMVEIRYDDIFDQHLQQWANLADTLKTSPANIASFNRVVDLLASVDDDNNLFAQYGGDVILYTAFDLIARRVRLRVNSIISNKITSSLKAAKDKPGPNPEFCIVGHSLGTTIVHDCLQQLASNNWLPAGELDIGDVSMTAGQKQNLHALMQDPANNPYAPGNFIWDSVFMVSNTSRLLHRTEKTPYSSLVQPGKTLRYFINVDHELDPVSKVKRFRIPTDWNRSRAFNITVDHIHQANVHAYAHYLKRPAVHRPLFRTMVPQFGNSCNDQAIQLEKDFPKYAGDFDVADKRAALRKKLNKLKADFTTESIARYRELIKTFSTRIGPLS